MNDPRTERHLDLVALFLIATGVSYLSYLQDSMIEGVDHEWSAVVSMVLVFVSYFSVYLATFKFESFLKIPRWIWVAVVGSLACAATWGEPGLAFSFGRTTVVWILCSAISIIVLGSFRFGERAGTSIQGVTQNLRPKPPGLPPPPPIFPPLKETREAKQK